MIDKEIIKLQAKEIMDNFLEALGGIEVEEEFNLKRENSLREESTPTNLDEDFRQRFLSNAKNTSGNAILANKGEWTKNGN